MIAINWSAVPTSAAHTASLTSRLRAIQRGVRLVLCGYLVLLGVALPGAVLWLGSQPDCELPWLAPLERSEDAEILGQLGGVGGGAVGYLLLTVGLWIGVTNAPQGHGAREWAFASVLLALLVPAASITAVVVGEAWEFTWLGAMLRQPGKPAMWGTIPTGALLLLAGGLLGLAYLLCYSQFLRALFLRAHDEKRSRRAERSTLLMCLVLGGSVGLALAPPVVRWEPSALVTVVAFWLLVLAGHVRLTLGACWYARTALAVQAPTSGTVRADGKEEARPPRSGCYLPLTVRLK
jgi:hypothetical protein